PQTFPAPASFPTVTPTLPRSTLFPYTTLFRSFFQGCGGEGTDTRFPKRPDSKLQSVVICIVLYNSDNIPAAGGMLCCFNELFSVDCEYSTHLKHFLYRLFSMDS